MRAFVLSLSLVLVVGNAAAQADPDPGPPPATPTAPTPETPPAPETPATPPAPAKSALDFDLFDDQPKPAKNPALDFSPKALEIERKIKIRRKVLTLHQGFGFATLTLLAATMVLGQLNYLDKYGGGTDTMKYQDYHLLLGAITAVSFTTTGLLSVFAPQPFPKKIKADKALLHKVLMGLATLGMVTQVVLGPITASLDGKTVQRNLALGHLVTGYATFGFMASGILAWVF